MPRARPGLLLALALLTLLPGTVAAGRLPDPPPTTDLPVLRDELPRATAGAILPGTVNRTSLALAATYDVDLTVHFGDRAIRMDSTATIRNTSDGPIDRVELNTVAARLGGMHLDRVTVDGRTATARVDDQTIVVPLGGVLPAGSTTAIRVIYRATMKADAAGSDWLFARTGGVVQLYRAIPWVSLRRPFDRPNFGDPFVTPSSTHVALRLTTDRPMVVAANARRTSASAEGRVQTFDAVNVRDLPLAMAPDFRIVATGRVGSTDIRVYGRPAGAGVALLDDAERSLAREAALLGPYPWAAYTVAEIGGGVAMEGPGTTWIPRGTRSDLLSYQVAHETAHSWTPGLTGSDQQADPFADEAVADMVARYTLNEFRASRCAAGRFDRPITAYSRACYYEVIYIQGGDWLNDVRRRIGNDTFWRALRGYLDAHRFGMGSSRQLLATLDAATPVSVAALARSRFPSLY
jgi:hypothetical protein